MTIPLQTDVVYGPVKSRRFGTSLGINLLPRDLKVCNYSCVYCQYSPSSLAGNHMFPTVQEVESKVVSALRRMTLSGQSADWITIAGNGEPTLHPNFPEIVNALIALRDRLIPDLPIGILSNSSTCGRPRIREALMKLSGRFMKLDTGREAVFCQINHPAEPTRWNEMVEDLSSLRNIVLQSMFFTGSVENIDDASIRDWVEAVNRIRPEIVQIYTIDRPPLSTGLLPASRKVLEGISDRLFERAGIQGLIF